MILTESVWFISSKWSDILKGWSSLTEKNACPYGQRVFPHGVEICDQGKCMVCKDGKLEDYADPRPPKYGLCVSVAKT